jgi:Holliday junction resolvase
MPLESTITKSIQVSAKARGWWVLKVAGGAFQRPGIPDLLCVKHGRAVWLEVKQPGKKPTPLQTHVIGELRNIGGAVAEVVTSRTQAEEILDKHDRRGSV